MFRTILKFFTFGMPWALLLGMYSYSPEHITSLGVAWLVVSPCWAMFIAFWFFWDGRAIAVIDTARDVISTVQDNKHHAVNAFNFVKSKVQK